MSPSRRAARKAAWMPIALVLLAVLVRLGHDAAMARTPFFRFPGLDASWHDEWAKQIVSGHAPRDPYFRAPGYAWFLAAVYRLAGTGPWPIHAAQALLGGLTTWLVYRVARRLHGRTAGLVAAGIAAFYGPLVYFDGELLAPTLAIPVFLLALHLTLRARTSRGWFLAGLAYGLGAVILPNILAVVAVLAPAVWLRAAGSADGTTAPVRAAALLVLGTVLVVSPVVIRNGVVGGDWGVLASQGGVNFYAGNNPKATGVSVVLPEFQRQPGWREFIRKTNALAFREAGRPLRPSEVSRFYTSKGLDFWIHSPGAALRLLGAKVYYLFNGHEIPNNRDLYSDRRSSPVLAALLWHAGPLHFPLGFLLPLAVLGLFMARPRGSGPLVLYLAIYAATVVLFFVTERYRLPLVPVLIVFAAGAIAGLLRGRKPGAPAAALAALVLIAANTHLGHAGESNRTQEAIRLAAAWFDAGDYRRSAEAYQAIVKDDPRSTDAWDGLGSALLAAGEKTAALGAFDEAARRGSLDPVTWFNRASILLENGTVPEAVLSLEKAVALDPEYANAWVNLGIARSALGRTSPALEALDRALVLVPAHAAALQEKGRLLASTGDVAGARRAFEAALAVSPGSAEIRLNIALIDYEEGRLDPAARELGDLLTRAPPDMKPSIAFHLARIAARRGDRAAMIEYLSRARAGGFGPMGRALDDPAFAPYRLDRELQGLAQ